MKNVLVTGAAGLIGLNFCDYLLKKPGVNVIGIDNMSGGYVENVDAFKIDFYAIDFAKNYSALEELFKTLNIDYVYHFGAFAAQGLSPFVRRFNYENNVIGTANVVNCCINYNVKRLVFASSISVYGALHPPFDETDNPAPIEPYGISKYTSEMDIQSAGKQHGLDWCILRPHNVYGKKQNIWDKYRNVLGIWMNAYKNNKPLVICGDGFQVRAFSYIDDIMEPLWVAGMSPKASKQIINLGGIQETDLNSAANILIKVMGGGEKLYEQTRYEVKHAFLTHEKSVRLLGFEHKTDLEAGLRDMWAWAKEQPNREPFVVQDYEIKKGLYDYWK